MSMLERWMRRGTALMLCAGVLAGVAPVRADDVAEATVLFAEGNEQMQRATRLRGARRTEALEAALTQYLSSLQRVRSRNVLYNTAIVLEMLGRPSEAFNYWTEYLSVQGLSEAELSDGRTHRDALRAQVAVITITANTTAEVWIDRRDLGARGHTPLDIAIDAGPHTFFLSAPGYQEAQGTGTATLGQTSTVSITLQAMPVLVQVLAPSEAVVDVDGNAIQAGQSTPLSPGNHIAHVRIDGELVSERRFDVVTGSAPMVIDLSGTALPTVRRGTLTLASDVPVQVAIDGVLVGSALELSVPMEAGPHQVRVSAPGRQTFEATQAFTTFPARYDVQLAPAERIGIHVTRGIFGLLSLGFMVGGAVQLVVASDARTANAMNPTADNARALRDATNITDVLWSIGAATGAVAVILLVVDAGGGESSATLTVEPAVGGGSLSLRGTFGGAL
jgi:hypothetical protein